MHKVSCQVTVGVDVPGIDVSSTVTFVTFVTFSYLFLPLLTYSLPILTFSHLLMNLLFELFLFPQL